MTLKNNITEKNNNLELSIQISLSGLSFCILNKELNTITALKHFNFDKKLNHIELLDKLKYIFNSENSLQNNFKNIIIIHENELFTLVPKALFNKNSLADYLKFNAKILKSDLVAYDQIDINESVNVYVPYVNINNFIFETLGSFTFKHISSVLIQNILEIEKHSQIPKLYVNVNKQNFEILVTHKVKLIFFNTFEYNTKEDFIYYILFTAEQLELNPETLNLIFVGDISIKDDLYIIAYKYIRFVFLGNREDNYKYASDAQPTSNHSDFALIKSL